MTETEPPPDAPSGATRTDIPPAGPAAGPSTGPRVTREEVRDLARLRRTTGVDRTIGGVAGGLGRHLDIDPVILKVAFVVLAFFGGAGLLLYAAVWLLVPDDRSSSARLGLDDRSRTIGLVLAGGVAALAVLGTSLGDGFVPIPVVVLAGIVLLVALQVGKRRGPSAPGAPPAPAAATPYAAAAGSPPAPPEHPAPVAWAPPPAVKRVDPRKTGPLLFWFTLALSALGLGLLGTLDVAGVGIPDAAYPALVVGICGLMLLVGAFFGRAGGIILVGLLATLGLVATAAAHEIDGTAVVARPSSAAAVQTDYEFDTGRFVLDLRGVSDVATLAGRSVTVSGDVGRLEVLLPAGVVVEASGSVDGPGSVDVLGSQADGIDVATTGATPGATPDAAPLYVHAELGVGSIQIRSAS